MKLGIFLLLLVAGIYSCQGVTVKVNTSKAPALKPFGTRVKQTLEKWYPKVKKQLMTPTFKNYKQINLFFDPNYDGVAYASGNRIVGAREYYKKNKDMGSMIHEMTHVIQQHRAPCPVWVTEGLADWIRYWKFQPKKKPGKPPQGSHFTQGYGVAAFFLNWVNKRHPRFNHWIHKDCREGTYNDNIFPRLTGKNVNQLWSNMMSSREVEDDISEEEFWIDIDDEDVAENRPSREEDETKPSVEEEWVESSENASNSDENEQ